MLNQKNQTQESEFPFQKIIVAVDGSPNSSRAARVAITLSKDYSAKLMVLHVLQSPTYDLYAARGYGPPLVRSIWSMKKNRLDSGQNRSCAKPKKEEFHPVLRSYGKSPR